MTESSRMVLVRMVNVSGTDIMFIVSPTGTMLASSMVSSLQLLRLSTEVTATHNNAIQRERLGFKKYVLANVIKLRLRLC